MRGPGIPHGSSRLRSRRLCCAVAVAGLVATGECPARGADDPAGIEFFETRVRPVLVAHCDRCHSAGSKALRGGLRLDLRAGWQRGGESGEPAIVPGQPDESPLIRSVRHAADASAMPPDRPRLPKEAVDALVEWVRRGAPDPRAGELVRPQTDADWETVFRERMSWWSLQPIRTVPPPAVKDVSWPRTDVDRFVLAALESQGLRPVPEADRRILARRLSFALVGLPPDPDEVERFAADPAPAAFESLVDRFLAAPHFGEHWARHWMDVVHYADTHGYEWDAPAKNAWMYRDWLVRAFNGDLPYDRFVLEQIAGDLVAPRVDPTTGLVESLVAPMALRLGERRHGDDSQVDGVTREAVADIVDTVGKAFLGTTLACARCHDHKLDAVAQRDYYALAGTLLSTRWGARTVDAHDPNADLRGELKRIKNDVRRATANVWSAGRDALLARIRAVPRDAQPAPAFPESLVALWKRSEKKPLAREEFEAEAARRTAANRANLKLLADFTREEGAPGWQWDGSGMRHGLVQDGDFVVADAGPAVVARILPAGRFSDVWSSRSAGALRGPLSDSQRPFTFSIGLAGGRHAADTFVIDQSFHSERMKFLDRSRPAWRTLRAGDFVTLEGRPDTIARRVYYEVVTKALNNYFPPRTGYEGLRESDAADPRSWFGVTKVWEHPPGKPPLDDLARFADLYADGAPEDWAERIADRILAAVSRWERDACSPDDALLLDEALATGWLANDEKSLPEAAAAVAAYRAAEARLVPDRVVGSAADWRDGRDEPIGIRGSYTEFGEVVPRGALRLLGDFAPLETPGPSGRLELARRIADPRNPLAARVYVNRIWQHLFGTGLVRTPDDFGHLGERPVHPELLDALADRFVQDGWSTKRLVARLVTSATWRQDSLPDPGALVVDPENRYWHHVPLRRLEAEAVRDSLLAVSGRVDPRFSGEPIEPYRTAQDAAKRLFAGPLDGLGRRSVYLEMTLMEPPRFLAVFNQPLPKQTVGRRDATHVPAQALTLLNDPFVHAMAAHWAERVVRDGAVTPDERAARMLATAFSRPARSGETERLVELVRTSAALRGASAAKNLLEDRAAWKDAAHALFNAKEFLHVP